MNLVWNPVSKVIQIVIVLGMTLTVAGCLQSLPPGAVGNPGRYNYSPSIIEQGSIRQFWWCSQGVNPLDSSQNTDAIYYASMNMATHDMTGPVLILAETPGAWDAGLLCNPKVIGGVFTNPVGDGQTYTYAMYYVAEATGLNHIGVAFSNDGMHWKKYPQPVIVATAQTGYGVGQPSLYNADHKSAITMFYEDWSPTIHHVAATSTDGVHFTVQGTLTSNGMDPDNQEPIWGDMSYDSKTREWYAIFCRPLRAPSTTGGVIERGQYGVEIYKIPADSLFTGNSPWQQLKIMDTSATGYESNFIAGFVHDPWGNINLPSYPNVSFYTSISYPQQSWDASPEDAGKSARPGAWIVMPMEWTPGNDLLAFTRYSNGSVHQVTTGWVSGEFHMDKLLGHIYANPLHGADYPLYGCKKGDKDYFVSPDPACEGERMLGKAGYAYLKPTSGVTMVPLYRCRSSHDHFVSTDPKCEGQTMEELLAYVLP
jgi:hypothetical protein